MTRTDDRACGSVPRHGSYYSPSCRASSSVSRTLAVLLLLSLRLLLGLWLLLSLRLLLGRRRL